MKNNQHQVAAFNVFKQLHQAKNPLLLINIWDAASAVLIQSQSRHSTAGHYTVKNTQPGESHAATAVATSSASLAWSLGYADGGHLPREELLAAVKRIQRVLDIPLSIDIETGYSDDISEVVSLAKALAEQGVAGINIEDGAGSPDLLSAKISAIKAHIPHLFINARCDVYLATLVEPVKQFGETLNRLEMYKSAGADGLFVPGLANTDIAIELQNTLQLPINLMAGSHTDIEHFTSAGVSRISVGPGSFLQAYDTLNNSAPDASPNNKVSYDGLNQLLCS